MKNPLYVVKNDYVQEARGILDLLGKKLNIEPLLEILEKIFKLLLDSVSSYASFLVVQEFIEEAISKFDLYKKYSIL